MPKFTVQLEYLLPIYKHVVVEADDATAACKQALENHDDEWSETSEDWDGCSMTFVAGVEEGVADYATGAVPEAVQTEQRKDLTSWFGTIVDGAGAAGDA